MLKKNRDLERALWTPKKHHNCLYFAFSRAEKNYSCMRKLLAIEIMPFLKDIGVLQFMFNDPILVLLWYSTCITYKSLICNLCTFSSKEWISYLFLFTFLSAKNLLIKRFSKIPIFIHGLVLGNIYWKSLKTFTKLANKFWNTLGH